MELSPHQIRTASFATSRKGFDPKEVESFLEGVAEALETAQNHSTAMEAKARAAIARMQELSAGSAAAPQAPPAPPGGPASVSPDQADQISRTLLLAQRAADEAVSEARQEAERILEQARAEATGTIETTRERSAAMLDEARAEARAAGSDESKRVRSEVEALLARREFLTSDVDHLEQFLIEQRERLREAAATLVDVAERVPGGLGHLRAPLVSAAATDDETGGDEAGVDEASHDEAGQDEGVDDDDEVADGGVDAETMPLIRPLDADDPTPTASPR